MWSELGKQLKAHFEIQRKPDAPLYDIKTYALYSRLICPYTSGQVDVSRLSDDDVLFMGTDFFAINGKVLNDLQLLWPRKYLLNRTAIKIVRYLDQHYVQSAYSFVTFKDLKEGGLNLADELEKSLLKLIGLGSVVRSRTCRYI